VGGENQFSSRRLLSSVLLSSSAASGSSRPPAASSASLHLFHVARPGLGFFVSYLRPARFLGRFLVAPGPNLWLECVLWPLVSYLRTVRQVLLLVHDNPTYWLTCRSADLDAGAGILTLIAWKVSNFPNFPSFSRLQTNHRAPFLHLVDRPILQFYSGDGEGTFVFPSSRWFFYFTFSGSLSSLFYLVSSPTQIFFCLTLRPVFSTLFRSDPFDPSSVSQTTFCVRSLIRNPILIVCPFMPATTKPNPLVLAFFAAVTYHGPVSTKE